MIDPTPTLGTASRNMNYHITVDVPVLCTLWIMGNDVLLQRFRRYAADSAYDKTEPINVRPYQCSFSVPRLFNSSTRRLLDFFDSLSNNLVVDHLHQLVLVALAHGNLHVLKVEQVALNTCYVADVDDKGAVHA